MISYNICRGHTPRIVFGITMLIVMLLAEGTGAAIDDASAHLSAEFAQSAVQINFGETISANISSASEMDTYTFSANSGDKILIRMDSSWANGPELRLYAPNGTQINYASGNGWCCNYIYSSEITQTLSDNGVYSILAGDYGGDNTGSYGIYIQRTNNPGNANPIGFGTNKSASINLASEMDTYTFSANSGDKILIRMDSSWANGPELRLYAPNGTQINYASGNGWCCNYIYSSEITQTLPANGVYTILAGDYEGHDTGSYGIYIQRTNNPGNANPIGFGETKSAYINSTAEMDTYTFSACSGKSILIRMQSSWANGTN